MVARSDIVLGVRQKCQHTDANDVLTDSALYDTCIVPALARLDVDKPARRAHNFNGDGTNTVALPLGLTGGQMFPEYINTISAGADDRVGPDEFSFVLPDRTQHVLAAVGAADTSVTLTTAGNAALFVADEVVHVASSDSYSATDTSTYSVCKVESADATTGAVTLKAAVGIAYATNPIVVKADHIETAVKSFASGTAYRLNYIRFASLATNANQTELPNRGDALLTLAASANFATVIAAKFARSKPVGFSADSVDFGSKNSFWTSLAEKFEGEYRVMLTGTEGRSKGGVVWDIDARKSKANHRRSAFRSRA